MPWHSSQKIDWYKVYRQYQCGTNYGTINENRIKENYVIGNSLLGKKLIRVIYQFNYSDSGEFCGSYFKIGVEIWYTLWYYNIINGKENFRNSNISATRESVRGCQAYNDVLLFSQVTYWFYNLRNANDLGQDFSTSNMFRQQNSDYRRILSV